MNFVQQRKENLNALLIKKRKGFKISWCSLFVNLRKSIFVKIIFRMDFIYQKNLIMR